MDASLLVNGRCAIGYWTLRYWLLDAALMVIGRCSIGPLPFRRSAVHYPIPFRRNAVHYPLPFRRNAVHYPLPLRRNAVHYPLPLRRNAVHANAIALQNYTKYFIYATFFNKNRTFVRKKCIFSSFLNVRSKILPYLCGAFGRV